MACCLHLHLFLADSQALWDYKQQKSLHRRTYKYQFNWKARRAILEADNSSNLC